MVLRGVIGTDCHDEIWVLLHTGGDRVLGASLGVLWPVIKINRKPKQPNA